MGFFAGRGKGNYFLSRLSLDLGRVSIDASGGTRYFAGTGWMNSVLAAGTYTVPLSITNLGAFAGVQSHVKQNIGMTASAHLLTSLFVSAGLGNIASAGASGGSTIEGATIFVHNLGTGQHEGRMRGCYINLNTASGSKCKTKMGLQIDVTDAATSHYSGGGIQGILLQLNATSIVNNQVDCILINQNSAQMAFSGITFKGKIGAIAGNGAVVNFQGSGDQNHNEGNKEQLFKFRTGGTSYIVTPAQFGTALGANKTAI